MRGWLQGRLVLPNSRSRSSGLDISLAGAILAILSFYAAGVSRVPATAPNLIRFFEQPPGTSYPAVMPQDAALLLLADPATSASPAASGGLVLPPVLGSVWTLLAYVGIALVVLGPLWARYRR